MSEPEYAAPENVTAIRLYEEEGVGSGGDWAVDGIDAEGKYTEACWTFDTEDEARAAIPEFCQNHGIRPGLDVIGEGENPEGAQIDGLGGIGSSDEDG